MKQRRKRRPFAAGCKVATPEISDGLDAGQFRDLVRIANLQRKRAGAARRWRLVA